MSALYLCTSRTGKDGVVRAPRAGDAIGAALRGVFPRPTRLPDDMASVLAALDADPRGAAVNARG